MATGIQAKRPRKKKSVLKRIRRTARRTAINRSNKSTLRTQVKKFRRALASGNLAEARELLGPTLSVIDHSIHKGIIHPNTAARTKSRLQVRYNALVESQKSAGQPAAS